ncbi:MAG: serine O-acetyltransferase [Desulfotomaculaceae bacterium]|nr:serine O-acetyltransferase [Desulfotomaculaceae bacterium]
MLGQMGKYIRSIMDRDPAARSAFEVILCYPGFHAVLMHRVAHFFYCRGWFIVARLLSHFSRFLTGIEIHPGAKVGHGLFIDHGNGVVIGETAEIGDNVTIYQGVTLGGTGKEKGKRHPTIGNNVVISSGARVLGSFTVGDNSRIGAGSVVLKAVPANSTVVGVPGKIVARDGQKVALTGEVEIDLRHDLLPDPVAEAMLEMRENIDRLEKRVKELESWQSRPAV